MDNAFESWYTNVIRKWEGGAAERDPKDDPGGLTKHGVTIGYWTKTAHKIVNKPATREGLLSINWDDAKKIAYQDFWVKKKINTIENKGFRPFVADAYWLGGGMPSLGYSSITALNKNKFETVTGLYNKRLKYLKSLDNWEPNKNGWIARMGSVMNTAKDFAGKNKAMVIGGVLVGTALLSYGLYELNKEEKWI